MIPEVILVQFAIGLYFFFHDLPALLPTKNAEGKYMVNFGIVVRFVLACVLVYISAQGMHLI